MKQQADILTTGFFCHAKNEFRSNFNIVSSGRAFVGVTKYNRKYTGTVLYCWEKKKYVIFSSFTKQNIAHCLYNTATNYLILNYTIFLIIQKFDFTNCNGKLVDEIFGSNDDCIEYISPIDARVIGLVSNEEDQNDDYNNNKEDTFDGSFIFDVKQSENFIYFYELSSGMFIFNCKNMELKATTEFKDKLFIHPRDYNVNFLSKIKNKGEKLQFILYQSKF